MKSLIRELFEQPKFVKPSARYIRVYTLERTTTQFYGLGAPKKEKVRIAVSVHPQALGDDQYWHTVRIVTDDRSLNPYYGFNAIDPVRRYKEAGFKIVQLYRLGMTPTKINRLGLR